MTTLGVDTSNYATSLAVVDASAKEVVYTNKQLLDVKNGELGLRQSEALFQHIKALPNMLTQLGQHINMQNISAVGVSVKPRPVEGSYMPCFMAGYNTAQAIAIALDKPLVETSHQQGHVVAALFGADYPYDSDDRFLIFHVSGGTTELLLCEGCHVLERVGESLDLYAGQAVDRLGVRLGMSFPAGAKLSELASDCEAAIKPKISVVGADCHLSGLQNICEKLLEKESPAYVAKYCLCAIADTLTTMLTYARKKYGMLPAVFAGGVMSSRVIKEYMTLTVENVSFVDSLFAGDNAIGVALIAAKEAGIG